jgi:hypothetical protein
MDSLGSSLAFARGQWRPVGKHYARLTYSGRATSRSRQPPCFCNNRTVVWSRLRSRCCENPCGLGNHVDLRGLLGGAKGIRSAMLWRTSRSNWPEANRRFERSTGSGGKLLRRSLFIFRDRSQQFFLLGTPSIFNCRELCAYGGVSLHIALCCFQTDRSGCGAHERRFFDRFSLTDRNQPAHLLKNHRVKFVATENSPQPSSVAGGGREGFPTVPRRTGMISVGFDIRPTRRLRNPCPCCRSRRASFRKRYAAAVLLDVFERLACG